MLWFGKQMAGVPYVGGTLDRTKEEVLIVNTRELDCTTYVEMVTALTLYAPRRIISFSAFCEYLRNVRYVSGEQVILCEAPALFHDLDRDANERRGRS